MTYHIHSIRVVLSLVDSSTFATAVAFFFRPLSLSLYPLSLQYIIPLVAVIGDRSYSHNRSLGSHHKHACG